MSAYDLPDDWDAHFTCCDECGGTYHRSGVYECDCEPCDKCGEYVAELVSACEATTKDDDRQVCQDCFDRLLEEMEDDEEDVLRCDFCDRLAVEEREHAEDCPRRKVHPIVSHVMTGPRCGGAIPGEVPRG